MKYITMNTKELEQAKIFEQIKLGIITQREAAARLRITARWVRKKYKRYCEFDDFGLVHGSRGKASPNRWASTDKDLLISLLQEEWHGFGPTFAAEKLEEVHQIKVSNETVRRAMICAGFWQAKETRVTHRKRRERRAMLGMMIQLDGSPHDWFEGRGKMCTLLVFIDDATSKILWLQFADAESTMALLQATKNYVEKNGIPGSFYTDHGSALHINLNNPDGDKKTQWERACSQLGIEVKHAHSPQAKGRVERCNQTMQDRLIKEMRLAKIDSIESANEYLRTGDFIERHNRKFAVQAAQAGDAHASAKLHNLNEIFAVYETRTIANDFTIQHNKQIFQLEPEQKTIVRPKDKNIVRTYLNGEIKLWIRRTELFFNRIRAKPKKPVVVKTVTPHNYRKPSKNSQRWASGLIPTSRVKPAAPAVEAIK